MTQMTRKDALAARAAELNLVCTKVESDGWESAWERSDGLHIWRTATHFRSAWIVDGRYAQHETHDTLDNAAARAA